MYKAVVETSQIPLQKESLLHRTVHLEPQPETELNLEPLSFLFESPPVVNGKVHLLRNLQATNNQPYTLKSRAILILNHNPEIQSCIMNHLECIENYYIVQELGFKSSKDSHEAYKTSAILILKSLPMIEKLSTTIKIKFPKSLLFYIEFAVLYIQPLPPLPFIPLPNNILIDEETNEESWIELPTCPKCLSIIEPELTGIEEEGLDLNSESEESMIEKGKSEENENCLVCLAKMQEASTCSSCKEKDDNWICMICSCINCGRYKNGDAFKHYTESKHAFGLDLKTMVIWDYKNDCFSHRVAKKNLMQEGELGGEWDEGEIEEHFWKYWQVVSEQLEKQRKFYTKMREEEGEKWKNENNVLEQKINELDKIKEDKKESLKKKVKKSKKVFKRLGELEEERLQERELCRHLEESGKSDCQETVCDTIVKKRSELKDLENQIEQVLLSLSET